MFFAYLFFSVLVKVRNNAMILPTWTWRWRLQLLKANETRKTLIIWNHWRTTKIKCERVNCLFPTNFSVDNTIISVFNEESEIVSALVALPRWFLQFSKLHISDSVTSMKKLSASIWWCLHWYPVRARFVWAWGCLFWRLCYQTLIPMRSSRAMLSKSVYMKNSPKKNILKNPVFSNSGTINY